MRHLLRHMLKHYIAHTSRIMLMRYITHATCCRTRDDVLHNVRHDAGHVVMRYITLRHVAGQVMTLYLTRALQQDTCQCVT
jgi:hypothetical protein